MVLRLSNLGVRELAGLRLHVIWSAASLAADWGGEWSDGENQFSTGICLHEEQDIENSTWCRLQLFPQAFFNPFLKVFPM